MVKLLTFEHFMLNSSSAVVVPFRRTYTEVLFVTKVLKIFPNAKNVSVLCGVYPVMNEVYQ